MHEFNLKHLGSEIINTYYQAAVTAKNEQGESVGGIHGDMYWDWLYIDTLWVDEKYRGKGVGSQLLDDLERLAISKGVFGGHLETTDFQALEFYKKKGYKVFGELNDKPIGHT